MSAETVSAPGADGPRSRSRGPMRHYQLPPTLAGKLWDWRFLIARRLVQASVLLLFIGTVRWGWTLFGQPLLSGNLSGSEFVGLVPLADPFATLQIIATGHWPELTVLIGALLILLFYGLVGGRSFCSWVCPINPVTDLAGWIRNRLGIRDPVRVSRRLRYGVLAAALLLSALTGLAAFEWVSPIAMAHRELIFGVGYGWAAVLGVFLFDLLVLRQGWCGHLCPLGAFYALVGKAAPLRVAFDDETCTHCGDCARVCPEAQVLDFKQAAANGYIRSGECSNCGRCVPVCEENSLSFHWRMPGMETRANPLEKIPVAEEERR